MRKGLASDLLSSEAVGQGAAYAVGVKGESRHTHVTLEEETNFQVVPPP